jgi:hypothetical protein
MRFARIFAVLLSLALSQVLAAEEAPAGHKQQQVIFDNAGLKLDSSVLSKNFIKRSVEMAKEKISR